MNARPVESTTRFPYASRREIVSEDAGDLSKNQNLGFDLAEGRDGTRLDTNRVRIHIPAGSTGLRLAAEDFARYLRLSIAGLEVHLVEDTCSGPVPEPAEKEAVFLVGNPSIDQRLEDLYRQAGLPLPRLVNQAYAVEAFCRGRGAIIIWAGETLLSQQYAIYHYAERVLGVRYPTPTDEIIPRWERLLLPVWSTLQRPLFSERMVAYWTCNQLQSQKGHILNPEGMLEGKTVPGDPHNQRPLQNSPLWWLYAGVELGRTDLLIAAADWPVKVGYNLINWNHEWREEVIRLPDEYIRRERQRGVGAIGIVSAGTDYGHDIYSPEEQKKLFCCSMDPDMPTLHHCIESDSFWKNLDRHFEQYFQGSRPIRDLRYLMVVLGESFCSHRAGYCPCQRCGHIPNTEKSRRILEYLTNKLADKEGSIKLAINQQVTNGLAPSGTRYDWMVKTVGDHPADGLIAYRPAGDHWYHEFGGLLTEIERRNRVEGSQVKAFMMGEVHLMMGSDLPLVTPIYFPAQENRLTGIRSFACTSGLDVEHYSFASLEWLKSRYQFANSWEGGIRDWRQFFQTEFSHLFGKSAGRELQLAMESLLRVESKELLWQGTGINQDAASWKGALYTIFHYFRGFFTNFEARPPMDLLREKELWDCASSLLWGAIPQNTYSEFLNGGWKDKQKELSCYDGLLEDYRAHINNARDEAIRYRDYFDTEFYRPLRQTYLFLKSDLLLALAYCRFTQAENYLIFQSREADFVRLTDQALALMTRGINMIGEYYATGPYGDWSAELPDPAGFAEVRSWWQAYRDAVAGEKFDRHPVGNEWGCKAETVEKYHRHEFPNCYASPESQGRQRRRYSFLHTEGI